MRVFNVYGYISNLKINYSKSEALNLTLPQKTTTLLQANCPFKWEPKALKYLGVWLIPSLSFLFDSNFTPLLKSIEQNLKTKLNKCFFSWFGQAAILKMTILPKLLYLLHALPIKIPNRFF